MTRRLADIVTGGSEAVPRTGLDATARDGVRGRRLRAMRGAVAAGAAKG